MKKPVGKNIKILRYFCLIAIVSLGLLTIVGSGGGGGNGDDTTTTTTTIPNNTGSLKIINNTSKTITDVYLPLTTADDLGSDQLPETISPGQTWTLTNIPPGDYILALIFSDVSGYIHPSTVYITAGQTVTIYLDDPTIAGELKIQNDSSKTIKDIYFVPSSYTDWGSDLLSYTVGPGYYVNITNIAPGNYNLKLVATDNATITKYDIIIIGGITTVFTVIN